MRRWASILRPRRPGYRVQIAWARRATSLRTERSAPPPRSGTRAVPRSIQSRSTRLVSLARRSRRQEDDRRQESYASACRRLGARQDLDRRGRPAVEPSGGDAGVGELVHRRIVPGAGVGERIVAAGGGLALDVLGGNLSLTLGVDRRTPMRPHQQTRTRASGLARARMLLKSKLGWLEGFPSGERWVVVPHEGERGPESLMLERKHLRQATYAARKLQGEFPHRRRPHHLSRAPPRSPQGLTDLCAPNRVPRTRSATRSASRPRRTPGRDASLSSGDEPSAWAIRTVRTSRVSRVRTSRDSGGDRSAPTALRG